MNSSNNRVRRATLDDLTPLSALWKTMHLPVDELARRITEFQIVESADGKLLGAVGFRLEGRHGRIHAEVFSDFGLADQLRPLLWQRLQAVVLNHGIARLWTQESAPYWRQNGFQTADADALKKLPAAWNQSTSDWLTLKLKDEEAIMSFEKELALFMQAEKQRTAGIFKQAQTIKTAVTVAAFILAFILFALGVYFLIRHQRTLQPH